jgi:hypothetical protein
VSLSAISSALVSLVAGVAGVVNVDEEEPEGTNEATALAARTDGDRVHFWRVKVAPIGGEYGAGYVEPRYSIRIRGYYGVAREAPADGTASDRVFRDLAAAVLQELEDKDNRNPGDCVETSEPQMAPLVTRIVQVGPKRVRCHVAEITYSAQEE